MTDQKKGRESTWKENTLNGEGSRTQIERGNPKGEKQDKGGHGRHGGRREYRVRGKRLH